MARQRAAEENDADVFPGSLSEQGCRDPRLLRAIHRDCERSKKPGRDVLALEAPPDREVPDWHLSTGQRHIHFGRLGRASLTNT